MGPIEALGLARQKEIEAADRYRELAQNFPEIKDLAYMLLNEEEKHKQMIEKKIVELQK
jgi:rubrerythrin